MRKMNWGVVQTTCLVGFFVIVNLSLRPGRPIPSDRLAPVWIFRILTGGVCLVGAVVAGIYKERKKAAQGPIVTTAPALAPGTRAISVTYSATREEETRCVLFILFNRPGNQVVLLVLGAGGAWLAASKLATVSLPLALLAFPVFHLLAAAAWAVFLGVMVSSALKGKFPEPDSVRVFTTSLTAEGLQDVTPEKIIPIPWSDLRWVGEAGGDIFFWKGLSGCYIPRSAFESHEEARRYHRAAVDLWKSRGATWPDDVPAVIDKARPAAVAPARSAVEAVDTNPYAAPRVPIDGGLGADEPPRYASLVRRAAGVLACEYLVLIPVALTR